MSGLPAAALGEAGVAGVVQRVQRWQGRLHAAAPPLHYVLNFVSFQSAPHHHRHYRHRRHHGQDYKANGREAMGQRLSHYRTTRIPQAWASVRSSC